MKENFKIYFASDAHLGMHPLDDSLEREKLLVRWLEEVRQDATEIYLLGDIFDYWFEYKKVVPRGFTRFLGKVAEITDQGIPVHYFTGNHDVWVFNYLPQEIGIEVHKGPITRTYNDLKFYIAHGDGLWHGEKSYNLLKRIFTSPTLQWMYARLHPNFSTAFAHRWSKKSRYSKGISVEFLGEDKEVLILFAKAKLKEEYFDYFIFGHRHLPLEYNLAGGSKLFYLGDWIRNFTYAVFDGEKVELRSYK